jgi:predicted amidohydrolase
MRMLAAVAQMTSGNDLRANLGKARDLIADAVRRGAELVVLPENFALMGEDERAKFGVAEPVPGEGAILTAMRQAAREHKVALVLGGMPEAITAPEGRGFAAGSGEASSATHVFNTSVYLDAAGELRGIYRKIHLFDVAIPDGATYRESASVAPGHDVIAVDTPWGRLGMTICYDVRFPELYRALSFSGTRMVTVPAAFTLHTGRAHWHPLLQARAIENLSFVLAAAQYGRHNAKRVTYGHACIIDPWGQVLAEVGDREGVAVAELDFDYQDRLRAELPALGHRRL